MTRKINREGLEHIKKWEGKRNTAYRDVGGVLTIGYGHTSAAGSPVVKPGMKLSDKEVEDILIKDLSKFEDRVSSLVKVPLTDNQFATLVSFDFNTGALHKSTLLKKLNQKDYDSVPKELMKWVNAGGKKVSGLVNRRSAEVGLWVKGSHVSGKDIPAEPRRETTVTKENVSWLTGILSTLGLAGAGSGPLQYALAGILVVAFGVGLYLFIKKRVSPE